MQNYFQKLFSHILKIPRHLSNIIRRSQHSVLTMKARAHIWQNHISRLLHGFISWQSLLLSECNTELKTVVYWVPYKVTRSLSNKGNNQVLFRWHIQCIIFIFLMYLWLCRKTFIQTHTYLCRNMMHFLDLDWGTLAATFFCQL